MAWINAIIDMAIKDANAPFQKPVKSLSNNTSYSRVKGMEFDAPMLL